MLKYEKKNELSKNSENKKIEQTQRLKKSGFSNTIKTDKIEIIINKNLAKSDQEIIK